MQLMGSKFDFFRIIIACACVMYITMVITLWILIDNDLVTITLLGSVVHYH